MNMNTHALATFPRVLLLLLLLVVGLGGASGCDSLLGSGSDADPSVTDPARQVVRSPHGGVASAGPLATEVGASVLARGGNAVDAAVATSFALTVVEPTMSGIAGRASIIVRMPDGHTAGLDGLNRVPRSYEPGAPEGYARAATPGALAALDAVLDHYGTWSMADVVEPALRLAEDGFRIPAPEARRIASARDDLAQHPGSRAAFLDENGNAPDPGDLVTFPDYARVLEAIGDEGAEVFYRGWIADSIHADMTANGGFITREELATYDAREAILVEGEYRGTTLLSNFRPASGHTVIQALQMMEAVDGEVPGPDDEAEWASLVGQAMRLAMEDRMWTGTGSPRQTAAVLTSDWWAAERAQEIILPGPAHGATTASAWERPSAGGAPILAATEEEHTTHLSVVDRNGMAVALTQSLGPSLGTRLVSPGLGFPYATRLGSEPGSRPTSTISPTIVVGGDGDPAFVLGSAGDSRIITSVVQALSRALDHGASLEEAMEGPRVHPVGETGLRLERGDHVAWLHQDESRLRELGFEVSSRSSGYFGRIHAVARDGDGWVGVAEPRGSGGAAAPAR